MLSRSAAMRLSVGLALGFMSSLALAEDFGSFSKGAVTEGKLKALAEGTLPSGLVRTTGTVKKVCEKKGCWFTLEDGDFSARVTMKDYSFFVPQKLEGQKVLVEGVLSKKEDSVAAQKHYLEDAGASKDKIEAVKKTAVTYNFEASAVRKN